MTLDDIDLRLIRELQMELPLDENPYAALGGRLGISEEEAVKRIKALNASGRLKRVGAVLRHQNAGYTQNAMAVFAVEPADVETSGARLAGSPMVSHCYQRAAHEKWPYTLYAMLHSRSVHEIEDFVMAFTKENGIKSYDVLYSLEELKKSSMVFV